MPRQLKLYALLGITALFSVACDVKENAENFISASDRVLLPGVLPEENLDLVKAPGTEIFGQVDQGQRGLVGKIYDLSDWPVAHPDWYNDSTRLAHFGLAERTPLENEIVVSNLDIPERKFDSGFPSAAELIEWFAIRFEGRLNILNNDGRGNVHQFALVADDGSRLFIDDQLIIDHDKLQRSVDGNGKEILKEGGMALAPGSHKIVVEYFQGPRYHIALRLLWKRPLDASYVPVPLEALDRPQ